MLCYINLIIFNIATMFNLQMYISLLASDCGSLQSPLNGMVDTTGTKFGDTASYNCIPGYYIIGETTRTCEKSGVWSGVAPICQREY